MHQIWSRKTGINFRCRLHIYSSFVISENLYYLLLIRLNYTQRNEEGVAQIFFRTPEEADRCIEVLHGRWFAGQKITAETWDGVTKYKLVLEL